jgi:hypothetical protein
MKFKILMFDGRPVESVLYDRIVYCERDKPKLLDNDITMEKLVKGIVWKEPWRTKCEQLLRKCDLEEMELRFTKLI